MSSPLRVGVLALQGDFAAHATALAAAGEEAGLELEVRLVRRPDQLEGLAGLVLPGGESTTLLKLLALDGLDDALREFAGRGVLFGTCAGAILLSERVENPEQSSLGLLDAVIERNSYGRQVDGFIDELTVEDAAPEQLGPTLSGVFIRAPRFRELGAEVEVWARHGGDPVMVRQGSVLAATFHPEMTGDSRVARCFLELAAAAVDSVREDSTSEEPASSHS
ncbi:MAG: pyridoxal 5'-phosphate synthase glutaminase subunit PdxT [Acidobacteriota bacterium]